MPTNFGTLLPPTKEELNALNITAKEAALSGNRERTEIYRKMGVSLDTIARAVGASGNWDYAEFLVLQNPQALNLPTELAIGFKLIGDNAAVKKLELLGAQRKSIATCVMAFLHPKIKQVPQKPSILKHGTFSRRHAKITI